MEKIDDISVVQEISFKLLCEFDEICSRYGLRYSLGAGTLLGAIREHDFIPWDDDVDVLMPRPDYDQFITICAEQAELAVSVKNVNNMNEPFFAYTKYVDGHTLVREDIVISNDLGISMDIFPVDGLPKNKIKIRFHLFWEKVIKIIISLSMIEIKRGKSLVGFWTKKIMVPIARRLFSVSSLVRYLNKVVKKYSYDNSKQVAAQALNYGLREIMDRNSFEKYEKKEFHGRLFWCIEDYDLYLTNLFGDYMTPPPEGKRVSTHTGTYYYK